MASGVGELGSPWRLPPFVACAVVAIAACSSDRETAIFTVTQEIKGGAPAASSDFPSVVAITVNGAVACSGVLITPTTVLSSTRCFNRTASQTTTPKVDAVRVYAGIATVDPAVSGLTVNRISFPPTAPHPDLSLLTLTTRSRLTPSRINLDPTLPPSLAPVTLVGFGPSRSLHDGGPDLSTSGVLRSLQMQNWPMYCGSLVGPRQMYLCYLSGSQNGVCYDDGGPSFLPGTNVVAGIHAFNDPSCSSYSIDTRVDVYLSFLAPALCARDDYCAPDCGQAGLEPDPDCSTQDAGTAIDGGGAGGIPVIASGGATSTGGSGGAADAAGPGGSAGTDVPKDAGKATANGPDTRSLPASSAGGCGCRASHAAERHSMLLAVCVAWIARRRRRREYRSVPPETPAQRGDRCQQR